MEGKRILHMARGGVGKSYSAGEAVKEMNGVVIDTDNGWGHLSEKYDIPYVTESDWEKRDLAGKIVYIPADRPQKALEAVQMLNSAKKAGKPMTELLVFDGYSEYETKQIFMNIKKRRGESDGGNLSDKALDQKGWGYLRTDMVHLTAMMQPLETGAHLYATIRVVEKPDPFDPSEVMFRPAASGRFGDEIESYFDLVFPTFKRRVREDGETKHVRRTYFRPDNNPMSAINFALNDRFEDANIMPDFTDEFSLLWLLDILNKGSK